MPSIVASRKLVLLGAGHTHLLALAQIAGMAAQIGAQVVMVSESARTAYSGMIPGVLSGLYSSEEAFIDVRSHARRLGVALIEDCAVHIDPCLRVLRLSSGSILRYDVLSVNVGGVMVGQIANEGGTAMPVKPVSRFLDWIRGWERRAETVAVVGSGVAGIEVALAFDARLRAGGRKGGVFLIGRNTSLVPGTPALSRAAAGMLRRRSVSMLLGSPCVAATSGGVRLADGSNHYATRVAVVTGVGAWPVFAKSGIGVDSRGFALVNRCLQCESHPDIFACGDCATLSTGPLDRSGVNAVRQAPVLADNVVAQISGGMLSSWRGGRPALAIISDSLGGALAHRNGIAVGGWLVWRWKDYLDRKFMAEFTAPNSSKGSV